jgi:ABC-type amino acid transport substrate-binding protein
VPDALIALEKWPGKVKIIGPVSVPRKWVLHSQKTAPMLRAEFNRFLSMARKDGTLIKLVKKYYPSVFDFYPDFFK